MKAKKSRKNTKAVRVVASALAVTCVFSVSRMNASRTFAAEAEASAKQSIADSAASAQAAVAAAQTDDAAAAAQAAAVTPAPSNSDNLASANAAAAALGQITSASISVTISDAAEAQRDSAAAADAYNAAKQALADAQSNLESLTTAAQDAANMVVSVQKMYDAQQQDSDGNGVLDGDELPADGSQTKITEEQLKALYQQSSDAAAQRDAAAADVADKQAAVDAAYNDLQSKMAIASQKYNDAISVSGPVAEAVIGTDGASESDEVTAVGEGQRLSPQERRAARQRLPQRGRRAVLRRLLKQQRGAVRRPRGGQRMKPQHLTRKQQLLQPLLAAKPEKRLRSRARQQSAGNPLIPQTVQRQRRHPVQRVRRRRAEQARARAFSPTMSVIFSRHWSSMKPIQSRQAARWRWQVSF